MLRRVTISNLSNGELRMRRVRTESLAIAAAGVEALTHGFQRRSPAIAWETEEPAAALLCGNNGMLLGIASGGQYDLFSPHGGLCALGPGEDWVMAPQQRWTMPDTFLLPFTGVVHPAVERDYGEFLRLVADLKQWEAGRSG